MASMEACFFISGFFLHVWLVISLHYGQVVAQFNLYPPFVDPDKLGNAYGVTTECIQGLNQSLPECDSDLFGMVVNWDTFWWEQDNITDLCLGNCSTAAALWYNNVMSACDGQWLSAYGKWIPADSVAGRYMDGINTVCLYSFPNDTWCVLESQNWIGTDVYQVDCDVSPSDATCVNNGTGIDPVSQRMANLYTDDLLCSDCFVQLLYRQVTSPFLADTDHADYLVEQLQDIADVCSTAIPDITTRASVSWDAAPAPTATTTTTTTTAPPASTSCVTGIGQTISSGSDCNALSHEYGLTTGDLKAISGSDTCTISSTSCFPASCTLAKIPLGTTCDSLATKLNVTTLQFQKWNPNIIGLCDALSVGQYVCVAAPGVNGTYTLPPPPLGTGADAGNQQRGGDGGIVTPTTTISTGPPTPVPAPGPVQSGVSPLCNAWQTPAKGLGCVDFAQLNGIGSAKLYTWNPVLGPSGENCTTQFWFQEYYCVGVVLSDSGNSGSATTTTTISTATTGPVSAPGPTQTGIAKTCNKFAQATPGMGCSDFATQNGITADQLYDWNSVLGSAGANCGTQFWANEWYCVGVTQANTSSSTAAVVAPGPTQSGIPSGCNKYVEASSGMGCVDFATQNAITPAQLYQWNPVLGPNGENCGTSFWANEWYCVSVRT